MIMKRILILLTVLSCIMTVACSGSSEELSKKDEPETEPKDTTNVDTTTTEKKDGYTTSIFMKNLSMSLNYLSGLSITQTHFQKNTPTDLMSIALCTSAIQFT